MWNRHFFAASFVLAFLASSASRCSRLLPSHSSTLNATIRGADFRVLSGATPKVPPPRRSGSRVVPFPFLLLDTPFFLLLLLPTATSRPPLSSTTSLPSPDPPRPSPLANRFQECFELAYFSHYSSFSQPPPPPSPRPHKLLPPLSPHEPPELRLDNRNGEGTPNPHSPSLRRRKTLSREPVLLASWD